MLGQPFGVACGGGCIAADHDHCAGGHLGNGGQGGLVAAFARRVYHDHIGAGTLGGKLCSRRTGILTTEIRPVGIQPQTGGCLFGAVHSLRHDFNTDQTPAVRQHRKPDRAHAAVEVKQKIRLLQPGILPCLGVQCFGSGGIHLIKFMHAHAQRDAGKCILNDAGAKHGAGLAAQNHIGALTVAVN